MKCNNLRELSMSSSFTDAHLFTTDAIVGSLYISRSSAREYLNTLYRDGYIVKVEGRPVLFYNVYHIRHIDFSRNNYFYVLDHFLNYIKQHHER